MFFNYIKADVIKGFYSGKVILFVGLGFLVYTIISHIKYEANRKQMERELAKNIIIIIFKPGECCEK